MIVNKSDAISEHNIWLVEEHISYFWACHLWTKMVEFGIISSIWSVQIGF